MSFKFRYPAAQCKIISGSGNYLVCGCQTSGPYGDCSTCCGIKAPYAWDVDLSAFAWSVSGVAPAAGEHQCGGGGDCSSRAGVFTLISNSGSSCSWVYNLYTCLTFDLCEDVDGSFAGNAYGTSPLALGLTIGTSGSNCAAALTVVWGTSVPNVCNGAAYNCACKVASGPNTYYPTGITYSSAPFPKGSCGAMTLSLSQGTTLPDCGTADCQCCCLSSYPSTVNIAPA